MDTNFTSLKQYIEICKGREFSLRHIRITIEWSKMDGDITDEEYKVLIEEINLLLSKIQNKR